MRGSVQVQKVVGYDKVGNQIFERDAREYDKQYYSVLGISSGDLVKAIPILIACVTFWVNMSNFREEQMKTNEKLIYLIEKSDKRIDSLQDIIYNLNTYLSATTGKQFRDGRPGQ